MSGKHEYLPKPYVGEKTILVFSTMNLGYATTRFTGAGFQGLNSSDTERFQSGAEQSFFDSDRGNNDFDLSSDSEYPEWGKKTG